MLFVRQLAYRLNGRVKVCMESHRTRVILADSGITATAVHPGALTNSEIASSESALVRLFNRPLLRQLKDCAYTIFARNASDGAQGLLYAALCRQAASINGKFME